MTRDADRIRDIASKVLLPKTQWAKADFPEGIEHLTIWTEQTVIEVYENHDDGTSVTEVPRSPAGDADCDWEA